MSRRDQGVADVLSNTFLVAMTVSLMVLVVLTVTPRIGPEPSDHVQVSVEATATTLRLVHLGGDPIYLETAKLHLLVDGAPEVLELSWFIPTLGEEWTIGEEVCISGATSDCADYGGSTITEVRLVTTGIRSGSPVATTGWTGSVQAVSPPP